MGTPAPLSNTLPLTTGSRPERGRGPSTSLLSKLTLTREEDMDGGREQQEEGEAGQGEEKGAGGVGARRAACRLGEADARCWRE